MSESPDLLEWLTRPSNRDNGIDRKVLAGLFLDIARNVQPELAAKVPGSVPIDVRLEQLRTLLVGQEIEALSRLTGVLEDPEQFAAAVSRVLPSVFALAASSDTRLGQVLAPTLEQATQSWLRNNPRTLLNILYPLILPAIIKSIGETLDKSVQSFNETLKHSLTWRGLRWRWEAWRTGTSFADVVLRHTLIYQVEHVFLIHRHTGLLISHVAAKNAASQDPQLVSSMLTAIQDFVRDSFSGAEQQGLDTLRLGELRLWSEPGPFATLVAVIRGTPPERLHETLAGVLTRIHAERHQALEDFDGDSSGFADVEALLTECVELRQQEPLGAPDAFPRVLGVTALGSLLLLIAWGVHRWQENRRWDEYVATLRAQPGVVVTEAGRYDGKFQVAGLRDPLVIDRKILPDSAGIDPSQVVARWASYEGLGPQSVLRRLQISLDPPPSVTFKVDGENIVAQGSARAAWLDRARLAGQMLPIGAPVLDLSAVQQIGVDDDRRWADYVAELRTQPGIVVTEMAQNNGTFRIAGLRDPLAADPNRLLAEARIDPALVTSHWAPYQALDPQITLKRLQATLDPPPSVTLALDGDKIIAQGSAPSLWLERARLVRRMQPAGAPGIDLSGVRDASSNELSKLQDSVQHVTIRFNNNDPLPAPGQEGVLDELAGDLKELASLSASLHVVARVMVTGHADAIGQDTFNISLSLARAEAVRSVMRKRGVNLDMLSVRGAGSLEPVVAIMTEAARTLNRRVSFSVEIEEQP